jgi:hypothetical protein
VSERTMGKLVRGRHAVRELSPCSSLRKPQADGLGLDVG